MVINLSGTHKDLYSGTTGTAVITTGSYDDVLTVPTAAIRTENDKTVVTKVDGTATSTVEVTVGKVFGTYTQITKGLFEGDSVQIDFTGPAAPARRAATATMAEAASAVAAAWAAVWVAAAVSRRMVAAETGRPDEHHAAHDGRPQDLAPPAWFRVEALRGVDLDVAEGDYLAIMGPSGSASRR